MQCFVNQNAQGPSCTLGRGTVVMIPFQKVETGMQKPKAAKWTRQLQPHAPSYRTLTLCRLGRN
jgi:hypothetical protein